jgi:hypothetical protein
MQNNFIIWKPVVGYGGIYEVSSCGDVRSILRTVPHSHSGTKTIPARVLKSNVDSRGYACVRLSMRGKDKLYRVHRLVLEAFMPNEDSSRFDGNHINGNRLDNRLENLEWVTRSENIKHSYRSLGRVNATQGKFGALHHNALAVIGTCKRTGEVKVRFPSLMDAERAGYLAGKISQCVSGLRQSHRGLKWEKAECV